MQERSVNQGSQAPNKKCSLFLPQMPFCNPHLHQFLCLVKICFLFMPNLWAFGAFFWSVSFPAEKTGKQRKNLPSLSLSLSLLNLAFIHTSLSSFLLHLILYSTPSPYKYHLLLDQLISTFSFGLMFKKMKGISSYSKPFYGVGLYQNANSSFKHQALMQDYKELQKEAHVIRNKLDAAKQRKLMLAAEVRFLRRRYKWLLKTKSLNSSQEQHIEQPLNSVNQTKNKEEHFFSRMGTTLHKLPSIPDAKSNRKLTIGKQTSRRSASLFHNLKHEQVLHGGEEAIHPISTHVSDRNNRGGIKCGKETLMQCAIPSFDLNQKERMCRANDVGLRNSTVAFDLNQDSDLSRKEACMPSQTPLFDLNEISTEDEDFQSNFEPSKFEEAKMGLIRAVNDDQNDLKWSLCRNAEEGSSSVGKRKISWQDNVALSF